MVAGRPVHVLYFWKLPYEYRTYKMRVKPYVVTYIHTIQFYTHTYWFTYTLNIDFHVYDCLCPHEISMFTYQLCMTSSWFIPFHLSGAKSPKSPTKWAPKAEPCRAKVGEALLGGFFSMTSMTLDCSDLFDLTVGVFLGGWFRIVLLQWSAERFFWMHLDWLYSPSSERTKDFFHFGSIWMLLGC